MGYIVAALVLDYLEGHTCSKACAKALSKSRGQTMSAGRLILSVAALIVFAQIVRWRSRRQVIAARKRQSRLRGGALIVLILCSACAETQRYVAVPRAVRRELEAARTARLVALAKAHPNARPRARPAFPTEAPSYTLPDFRIDRERSAELLGHDGEVYEDPCDPIEASRYPILSNGRWP